MILIALLEKQLFPVYFLNFSYTFTNTSFHTFTQTSFQLHFPSSLHFGLPAPSLASALLSTDWSNFTLYENLTMLT